MNGHNMNVKECGNRHIRWHTVSRSNKFAQVPPLPPQWAQVWDVRSSSAMCASEQKPVATSEHDYTLWRYALDDEYQKDKNEQLCLYETDNWLYVFKRRTDVAN